MEPQEYHSFKHWMNMATSDEQEALAESLGVSRGYLYQLSSGLRPISPETAGKIVETVLPMRRKSKGRLPHLCRAGLCQVCHDCPHGNPVRITASKKG